MLSVTLANATVKLGSFFYLNIWKSQLIATKCLLHVTANVYESIFSVAYTSPSQLVTQSKKANKFRTTHWLREN